MIDFKIDQDGDLDIQDGDLVLTESTLQHQSDIIWAGKGWWHFAPSLGVALQEYINEGGSSTSLMRVIRQELERDGANVESVSVSQEGIQIDAHYNQ